jgi:hypothetical protein
MKISFFFFFVFMGGFCYFCILFCRAFCFFLGWRSLFFFFFFFFYKCNKL